MERPTHKAPVIFGGWQYQLPAERGLGWYLVLSTTIFVVGALATALIPAKEKLPPMIEVDLGIDGIENEPPPLGEPDAGGGEIQPEPAPNVPPATPEAEVEPPPPEPEPIPEPEMIHSTVPQQPPEFEVPEEAPKPQPVEKPKPKPRPAPKTAAAEAKPGAATQPAPSGPAGSGIEGAKPGIRGSPGGKPGGRGGGRGDFISTPQPQYDTTAKQRGYQGRGIFIIRYENGRIASVSTQQSTGVPYLDARTTAWIKSRWRVKSGTSGAASLPITWKLK